MLKCTLYAVILDFNKTFNRDNKTSNEDGNKLLNLHKIYDPALLTELIKFNHQSELN